MQIAIFGRFLSSPATVTTDLYLHLKSTSRRKMQLELKETPCRFSVRMNSIFVQRGHGVCSVR